MPRRIALDTSFVIGLIDDKDIWRSRSLELEKALEATAYRPVIFDCVLSEVISTLARRTQEKRRAALLPELLERIRSKFPTKSLVWLYPDLPEFYDEVVAANRQCHVEIFPPSKCSDNLAANRQPAVETFGGSE